MDAVGFRKVWLDFHGHRHPLTQEQSVRFLADPLVPQILEYSDADISVAARKFPYFSQILAELKLTSNPEPTSLPEVEPETSERRPRHETLSPSGHNDQSSSNRAGRSHQTGSVWSAPANPEEAKRATVDFDRLGREYQ